MKQTFKIFYTLIFTTIFLSITHNTALAKTFPTLEVGSNKSWVINFNHPINPDTILFQDIQVYNSKGKPEYVGILYDSNCTSTIEIMPPNGGYKTGEYTLKISNKSKSSFAKNLKENYELKFFIKDSKTQFIYDLSELISVCENNIKNFKIVDKKSKEVYDKAKQIISNVTSPHMTDYEKEKALHDYIVKNTSYDYDNYHNHTIPKDSYTPYGVLIKNTGVCQGYAETMKLLLNLVNIQCKVVHGHANGGGHAWNKVNIDGKEYNLDATWDDPVPDHGPNYVRYDYFNISDDELSKDHDWDIDITLNGKKQKISYNTYIFYKKNNIGLDKMKKINLKVSLPNGEKAPKGGAYVLVSIEQYTDNIDGNIIYEKECYIPEGKNSFDYSISVPLNKYGYIIKYYIEFEDEKPKYTYLTDGYYSITQSIPTIIKANNSEDYFANITIPKANLIKGKISLPNGEIAPKNGIKVLISLMSYEYLPISLHGGGTILIANSIEVTIPEGKNYIEYSLPASINKSGYYIDYQAEGDDRYSPYTKLYKADGINVTRLFANSNNTDVNIVLSKKN